MKKILVIDEDTDWLFAMECYLTREGYQVVPVRTYEDSFQTMELFKPGLIFLTIGSHRPDGLLLCRKITMHDAFGHLPIILLSIDKTILQSYRDYGAAACLKKPLALSSLREILHRHGKQQ